LAAPVRKGRFEAQQRSTEPKVLLQQGAIPRRDLETAEVALGRRAAKRAGRKSSLPICNDWQGTTFEIGQGRKNPRREISKRCGALSIH